MLLDPTKAHGCDNLSIKNVKICSMSVTVPLKIKFEQLLKEGKFLEIWKKTNKCSSHKYERTQRLNEKLSPYQLTSDFWLKFSKD